MAKKVPVGARALDTGPVLGLVLASHFSRLVWTPPDHFPIAVLANRRVFPSLRSRGSRSEHRSAAQGNASLGIRSLCPGSARNRRASRHHAGNTPCRFALVFSAGTVERKIGSVDSMDPAVTASMNRALSALSHRRSFACVRAIRSRFVVWFPSWEPPFRPGDASSLLRQAFSGAESIVRLL